MDMFTERIKTDPDSSKHVLLRLPKGVLARAGIDPLADVVMHAEGNKIVVEEIQDTLELMEMYAEEFVAQYPGLLQHLGDEECLRTD